MSDDPYGVLQVEPHADAEAIHAAYRRLARLYHPDLNTSPGAAEQMRRVNAAYALLSDAARRAAYDAQRFLPRARVAAQSVVIRPRQRSSVRGLWSRDPRPRAGARSTALVGILGVLVLIAIGFYVVNIIPMRRAGAAVGAQRGHSAARSGDLDRAPDRHRARSTAH